MFNEMMHPLKISIVQTDIAWENKQENLRMLREKLHALRGTTEIVVLPEMFSTGFTMKSRELAEPVSGITVRILKELAADFQLALCGSFICSIIYADKDNRDLRLQCNIIEAFLPVRISFACTFRRNSQMEFLAIGKLLRHLVY